MADDLAFIDATAEAELVRKRQVTPLELVDAAIARIEKLNPQVNAVITTHFESAREEAKSDRLPDGPSRGVPFLLKDLDAYSAGDPYHCGIRALKEAGWTETEDRSLGAKVCVGGGGHTAIV